MSLKPPAVRSSDIQGVSRLAFDAALGLTRLVETMHHNISRAPGVLGTPTRAPMGGITGLVYRTVRGVTGLVGGGVNGILARLGPLLERETSSVRREAVLAALNGVLGDHLAASANPLAITLQLRRNGSALQLTRPALAAAIPKARGRVLLLVHGLCLSDLQWQRKGHDHGMALERDAGFTAVYLNYNTGLHVSANGRACAAAIEALLAAWPVPVEELAIVGHSMGGLVARSACQYGRIADHAWLARLRRVVFLGTPHHGAPLERGGHWIDVTLDASPYTAAFSRLGRIRSAGITDLRYGNLLDEDWRDRDRFARSRDERVVVPLPGGVECFACAASLSNKPGELRGRLLGDGLVPIASALGQHAQAARSLGIPESRQWIAHDAGHLDLLDRAEVYETIRRWLA
jgi:pimeloyl-ACP methyl ester carboxylesterase